jgi:Fe-S cluster biogenesis protein NfuA
VSFPDLHKRLEKALAELLPAMVVDGGGAEIISIECGTVTLRLLGSCTFCPSRSLSASALVRGLRDRVPEISKVQVISVSSNGISETLIA